MLCDASKARVNKEGLSYEKYETNQSVARAGIDAFAGRGLCRGRCAEDVYKRQLVGYAGGLAAKKWLLRLEQGR